MLSSQTSASRIFRSVTAPRNLLITYRKHVSAGAARGRDGVTPRAVEDEIGIVCETISRKSRAGTYEFTAYRQLLVSKGAERLPRVISIPTVRDRILLKSLAFLIESVFPESKGKIAQRKVVELRKLIESGSFESFVRVDVRDFYPSISHDALFSVLRTKIRKPEVLSLIAGAIRTPTLADNAARRRAHHNTKGVPQGLSISNYLAELSMTSVDARYSHRGDMAYIRYVDDIIILCASGKARALYEDVVGSCKEISLEVHPLSEFGSKSRIGKISDSFDYLGYVFDSSKVSVRNESLGKIKSSLARVFTRYKYEVLENSMDPALEVKSRSECLWKLNLVITGCIFDGQRRGWLHYFSQIDDLSVLKGLDSTVRNFMGRFGVEHGFEPKTFMRAYWKINKGDNSSDSYVPDFDNMSADQKRLLLVDVFHNKDAARFDDLTTEQIFHREVKRLVDRLEQDISGLS